MILNQHLNIWQLGRRGLLGCILVGAAAAADDAVDEAEELVLELGGEVGHGWMSSKLVLCVLQAELGEELSCLL